MLIHGFLSENGHNYPAGNVIGAKLFYRARLDRLAVAFSIRQVEFI
jgi:hypothetical protein